MALKHALNIYEKKFGKVDITAYTQVTEPNKPVGIMDKCIEKLIKNKKLIVVLQLINNKKIFGYKKKILKRIAHLKKDINPVKRKKVFLEKIQE